MGSSGEMATAEHVKGERVVCSNAAVSRVGQMEKFSANQVTGLSPPRWVGWGGVCVLARLCFLPRLVEKLRLAAVSGAGLHLCNLEPCAGLWSASSSPPFGGALVAVSRSTQDRSCVRMWLWTDHG